MSVVTHDGFATTPSLLKNLNQKIENTAFEIRYSYIKNIYIYSLISLLRMYYRRSKSLPQYRRVKMTNHIKYETFKIKPQYEMKEEKKSKSLILFI